MDNRGKQILGMAFLIVGIALCLFGISLLVRPAQYAATIRIEIESSEPPGVSGSVYDPYFIQTTFEIIQSQIVLSNVVVDLNLNEVWGKKYFGGRTLTTSETEKMIQQRLQFAPVRNTKLIMITFSSDDPNEAAQVANAIVESYKNYRMETRKQFAEIGIAAYQEQFQDEEKEISTLQTNVEMLQQKFGIQNGATNNNQPEQTLYWDEKNKLEQMLNQHELLGTKIQEEKTDLQLPQASSVEIVDPAVPPKNPIGPNRLVGIGLIIAGLFLMMTGWFLFSPQVK
jgi:uncharacterized protein involved in exopolysaccharide biosynthesis